MSLEEEEYRDEVPFSSHHSNPHDVSLLMLTLITKLREQLQCYFERIKIRTTSDLNNILKGLCAALREWGVMLALLE